MTFALIIANPNSNEIGNVVSRHRSAVVAERARATLTGMDWRWSYIATKRADGSYPTRGEVK